MDEIERIVKEYNQRAEDIEEKKRWSALNDEHYYALIRREKDVIDVLKAGGIDRDNISTLKLLDVGCGRGWWLQRLVFFGADPNNLYGIDLVPDRIDAAKDSCSPRIHLSLGNAEQLPYPNDYFDYVFQFMVFTSILDDKIKKSIAKEMLRVLKPGGKIIWYDFPPSIISRLSKMLGLQKTGSYHIAPIDKTEINQLFAGYEIKLKKVTLHPKIAGMLRVNWVLSMIMEQLPFTRTIYLGVVKKSL